MATYGVSRGTTASPEKIWSVWSDPSSWGGWNPQVEDVELDRGLTPGSKGVMRSCEGNRTFPITIESIEPGQSFSLSSPGLPLTTFVFTCEVTPAAGGGSTIAQHAQLRGPLGAFFGVLMGNQMAMHFVPVLDGLAQYCEREA